MGAIDLVVQIEAPPSVASGLQRIGRGGHQIDRGQRRRDLPEVPRRSGRLRRRRQGDARRRGRSDPLSPQPARHRRAAGRRDDRRWTSGRSTSCSRRSGRAAPFAELSRTVFDGVLDMLSGRYPSDEFAELRPRVTWDRVAGTIVGARRRQARRDRQRRHDSRSRPVRRLPRSAPVRARARVGELDEEMVFESRVGETFVLGASSWRIEEITHDRVLVSPAPGQPGKMPFWKGDRAGPAARARPGDRPPDARPAAAAAGGGDRPAHARPRPRSRAPPKTCCSTCAIRWRPPAPSPTPAPSSSSACATSSATGASASCRRAAAAFTRRGRWRRRRRSAKRPASTSRRCGETTGSWCGFRMWTSRRIRGCCCPIPTKCRRWWSGSSARRRCSRRSSARTPRARCCCPSAGRACARRCGSSASGPPICWRSRRATDRFRCCSKPIASACATSSTCRRSSRRWPTCAAGTIRVATVDSETPSPFAASLLFSYVASFLYDGDAPLAERRAQALAVDQSQLRELLGDAELRELLDAEAMDAVEQPAAAARPEIPRQERRRHARHAAVASATSPATSCWRAPSDAAVAGDVQALIAARRVLPVRIAGEPRYIAVEDAARYRDALGVPLPPGIPDSLLQPVRRSARRSWRCATRARMPRSRRPISRRATGWRVPAVEALLMRLTGEGPPARGRVQARRHSSASGPTGRAAPAAPALARQAAARGRAGRSGGAWPAHARPGRGSSSGAAAPTRCSMSSSSCRARRCRPRFSRPTSCRRGSTATIRPISTRCCGRRSGLGRRRTARRARRPHRVVPGRSSAAPAAAARRHGPT